MQNANRGIQKTFFMIRLIVFFLLSLTACNALPQIAPSSLQSIRPIPFKKEGTLNAKVERIIKSRCFSCHHTSYTSLFPAGGIALDSPKNIKKYAERIWQRASVQKDMPLLQENILVSERQLIQTWYKSKLQK